MLIFIIPSFHSLENIRNKIIVENFNFSHNEYDELTNFFLTECSNDIYFKYNKYNIIYSCYDEYNFSCYYYYCFYHYYN